MREIVWSDTAIDQYADAFEYLAERNPSAAEDLRVRVREAVELVARRPIGRPGQSADTFEKIVRKTSYLLVFELVGDRLHILRLFHMAQNWHGWTRLPSDEFQ